jgi:DNA-binding NtrC family response regulator
MAAPRPLFEQILIVDDDPLFRGFITTLLQVTHGNVEAVTNVNDALSRLRETRFDLLITDLVMAGATGLDLIDHVIAENLIPPSRILVISGEIESSRLVAGVRSRQLCFLPKPHVAEQLESMLMRISL